MTTSNARKLTNNERRITMTTRASGNNLAAQKLTGIIMLFLVAIALVIGGDFAAVVVLAPLALAAIFSKEKILDFRIFANSNVKNYR